MAQKDDDEPTFVLRPSDIHAGEALRNYRTTCIVFGVPQDYIDKIDTKLEEFKEWRIANQNKVRAPGYEETT